MKVRISPSWNHPWGQGTHETLNLQLFTTAFTMNPVNRKTDKPKNESTEPDKKKKGVKINLKFSGIKGKAKILFSPRNGETQPTIIPDSEPPKLSSEEAVAKALSDRVAAQKHLEASALNRFGNCKTTHELKQKFVRQKEILGNGLFSAQIPIDLEILLKDYKIAQDAINYNLRDECEHYKIQLDEALEAFDFPSDLEQLQERYNEKTSNIGPSDTTSRKYYEEAKKIAETAMQRRPKARSEPSTEASSSKFDGSVKASLGILGIKEEDLQGKSDDDCRSHITACYRKLALQIHPDKHHDLQAFEFDKGHALARFNQMTPTAAIKDLSNARERLQRKYE